MSATDRDRCLEVQESLSQVLDGTAPAILFEHIAECDECRDLRYEATQAAEMLSHTGADFRAPEGFADRMIEGVLAARPDASSAEPSGSEAVPAPPAPAEPEGRQSGGRESDVETKTVRMHAVTPMLVGDARKNDEIATAPTTLEAPSTKDSAEPAELDSQKTLMGPAVAPMAPPEGALSADTQIEDTQVDDDDDVPTERPEVITAPLGGLSSEEERQSDSEGARAEHTTGTPAMSSVDGSETSSQAAPARGAETHRTRDPRSDEARKVVPFVRRKSFYALVVGGMAAAAAAGFALFGVGENEPEDVVVADGAWTGSVEAVARASTDKRGGLQLCSADGDDCDDAADGDDIEPGSVLKTDARTRARIVLSDGTEISMDRSSELELPSGDSRRARLDRGMIVADVAEVEDAEPARFELPNADVTVLGTKLAMTAFGERASVEVARGEVEVSGDGWDSVTVRAGEEATLRGRGAPIVASTTSLADMMEWSDHSAEDVDSPVLRGLGELRARKPGEKKEREGAVRLSKHSVKVRVSDVIARTEIDETFTNETDEELEGIFRFPLPPGAQIERLALEVEGELMEGAFVDRDRGAAIWRGVIQNAAPKAPKPREEIIWVPGPWKDPALLEWQRGGRFELRIFPIPKRGSRRVVLTYTQVVDQSAGVRRFTYPLAHDPSGTTEVESFDLDLQVLGHDQEFGVQTRGYELTSASATGGGAAASGGAQRFTMHADKFVPAGDLTVEYALPNRDKEITTWAYRMDPSATSGAASTAVATAGAGAKGNKADAAAILTAKAILDDTSPYVAIAVRPQLPRWQGGKDRLHVVVVDASRSMFGERYARATRLASSLVREMDRRDSFMVLACDTTCQGMGDPNATGGSALPSALPVAQTPSASAAGDVERFLGSVEPDGGSDVAAVIDAARAAASASAGGRELRIIYLGDGTPSVGPTKPAHLEAAVRHSLPSGSGAVVAVPLGTDADLDTLQAVARGGGGVVVPYVPGQRVSAAALNVLSAAYGVMLRDVAVELPPGLTQVTPAKLDPIPAGGERFIVARMNGDQVDGTVRLRGSIGGERFEQSYPTKIVATTDGGNAFVPRLFAAHKIAELERTGVTSQKATIVELSKRFAVASRHTSMIVLESQAMFDAFGLERNRVAPIFTGELLARSDSSDAEGEEGKGDGVDLSLGDKEGSLSGAGSFGGVGGNFGPNKIGGGSARAKGKKSADTRNPFGGADDGDFAAEQAAPAAEPPRRPASKPRPPSPPPPAATASPNDLLAPPRDFPGDRWNDNRRRRRPMVPMRRVFDRKGQFFAAQNKLQDPAKLLEAETALRGAPDSRDRTVSLYRLLSTSGRVGEALELTSRWSGRDALDPEALLARADLAARQGDRNRAIRILGGLADVRPDDKGPQERLVRMHEILGNRALACEHRITLAELEPNDAELVAGAVRCSRERGLTDLASLLQQGADDKTRIAIDALLTKPTVDATNLAGDVRLAATWTGGDDLDIALIDKNGQRISWMGAVGRVKATAKDVRSSSSETLALLGMPSGHYVVEVSRASRGTGQPVSGEITLTVPGGGARKVPFSLTGDRTEVGTLQVFFTSRLVPVQGSFGWR